jgi:hypothetical protein
MKKVILGLTISLLLTLIPTSSFASNDCPDSWQVDISKYPNNPQLLSAKQRLGSNMVETFVGSRVLDYAGVEGSQIPLKDLLLIAGTPRTFLLYLYGKSKVETTIEIEVKGCTNPYKFVFVSTYQDREYPIERSNAGDWATANPMAFTDFKKQESFVQDLSERVIEAQSVIDKYLQRVNSPVPIRDFEIFGNFRNLTKSQMLIQVMTPGCVYFDSRFRTSLPFKTGAACKFALAFSQRVNPTDPQDQRVKLVVLDSFELDFRAKSQTITCVKGKLTKKVTAVNPKCPTGYKKK